MRRIGLADGGAVSAALHAPEGRPSGCAVLLGHGAGSDMHNAALVATADGLARRGHAALRYNFPYREAKKKAPPDPRPRLEHACRAAADALRAEPGVARLVIGGRSMGGRIASLVAAAGFRCDGLVFFGYPLHPAGRKAQLRDAHLPQIGAPMLFVQGTRDALCDLDLLRPVLARIGPRATLHVVEGGDHSLAVLKSSGRSCADVHDEILGVVDRWIQSAVLG